MRRTFLLAGLGLWLGAAVQAMILAEPMPDKITQRWVEERLARQQEGEAKLRQALAARRDFDVDAQPLNEFLAELGKVSKIHVHLDEKGLEDEAISVHTPLHFKAKQATLDDALRLMFRPALLSHILLGDTLFVTTRTQAEDMIEARVYSVADLVLVDPNAPEQGADYHTLIDVLSNTVAPDTWDVVGGRGSVRGFRAVGVEVLVVLQSQANHDQIELLLAGIRKARAGNRRQAKPSEPALRSFGDDAPPPSRP